MWRHKQNCVPSDVRGLTRRTMVLWAAASTGNRGYVTDIKFREDGEIKVKAVFAGYLETRPFDPRRTPRSAGPRAGCPQTSLHTSAAAW